MAIRFGVRLKLFVVLLALMVVSVGAADAYLTRSTADQVTKYRVFRWLYNGGQTVTDGTLESHAVVTRWYFGHPDYLDGGRYDVVPGWFGFLSEYVDQPKPCDCGFEGFQTWSAPRMPHVNHQWRVRPRTWAGEGGSGYRRRRGQAVAPPPTDDCAQGLRSLRPCPPP